MKSFNKKSLKSNRENDSTKKSVFLKPNKFKSDTSRIQLIKNDLNSSPRWVAILKYVGIAILYLIILLSFIRVPYVGAFFDSTIFSFLFGWGKYLIYIFAFVVAILYWFPNIFKIIWNKKSLLIYYPIILLSFCLILSGIGVYVEKLNNSASFSQYFVGTNSSYITGWHNLDWGNVGSTNVFYANPHAYGGLITMFIVACFAYISSALLIVIGFIVLAFIIYLIIAKRNPKVKNVVDQINKKFKKPNEVKISEYHEEIKKPTDKVENVEIENTRKFAESFGTTTNIQVEELKKEPQVSGTYNLASTHLFSENNENINTFELEKDNLNLSNNMNDIEFDNESLLDIKNHKFENSAKYDVVKKYINSREVDVENLPHIDQIANNACDYLPILSSELNELIDTLSNYFSVNQLTFKLVNKEIMYQSVSATFIFEDANISEWINDRGSDISNKFKNRIIINKISSNKISFIDVINKDEMNIQPIVSFKDIISTIGYNNPYCYTIGKQGNRKAFYINGAYEPNTIVYGGQGSGRAMLLSSIVLSICFLNNPNNLDAYIIDTTNKSLKHLESIVQVHNNYVSSEYDALDCLTQINNIIKEEKDLFLTNNVNNIYDYNLKNKLNVIKHKLIVVNDINDILELNKEKCLKLLDEIISNAFNHGIILVLTSSVVNDQTTIFNKSMDNIIVLKVDDQIQSEIIFNTSEAECLCGQGDMLLKTNDKKTYHLQMPFANKNFCNHIIELINSTFGK